MTTKITHSLGEIRPTLVDGWVTTQESRNIVHNVIGSVFPRVTMKPAGTREGTLRMFFLTAGEAEAARSVMVRDEVFTCNVDEFTLSPFNFVVSGNVVSALEDDLRRYWFVEVDFTEVG